MAGRESVDHIDGIVAIRTQLTTDTISHDVIWRINRCRLCCCCYLFARRMRTSDCDPCPRDLLFLDIDFPMFRTNTNEHQPKANESKRKKTNTDDSKRKDSTLFQQLLRANILSVLPLGHVRLCLFWFPHLAGVLPKFSSVYKNTAIMISNKRNNHYNQKQLPAARNKNTPAKEQHNAAYTLTYTHCLCASLSLLSRLPRLLQCFRHTSVLCICSKE